MSWVSTFEGRHLSGRASANTVPEVLLRKALHAAGGRYRLHRRLTRGCTPDLVMPGRKIAVFVDGDFWHGCPEHFPTPAGQSGPNAALWAEKRQRVVERDARATRLAEELGWKVIRVWECEIRADAGAVALRLMADAAHPNDR